MSVYYWRLLGNLMKAEDKVQLAELSRQCGVDDGRKEVVDWVEEHVGWRPDALYKSAIDMYEWEAQLKKWGLE